MTDSPRYRKPRLGPDLAYTEYYGAPLVRLAFTLLDRWLRDRNSRAAYRAYHALR